MPSWFEQFLQNTNWNNLIVAALFGGLGYLAKACVDYWRERATKHADVHSELQKRLDEKQQDNLLVAIQAFVDLQETVERLFDLIAHMRNLEHDQRTGRTDYKTYILSAFAQTIANLLARLDVLSSVQLQLALGEDSISELRNLRKQLKQLLSDQGVFREYQTQIARYVSFNPGARIDMNVEEALRDATKKLFAWTEKVVDEFEDAFKDSFHGKGHRSGKSLVELGIQVPSEYDDNYGQISNLKLDKPEAELVALASKLYAIFASQDQNLKRAYRSLTFSNQGDLHSGMT